MPWKYGIQTRVSYYEKGLDILGTELVCIFEDQNTYL